MRVRPKKTSSAIGNCIITLAKQDPFKTLTAIAREIGNVRSMETVQRRLLKPKLPGRIALKVPLLGTATLKMGQNFAFCHRIWHVTEGSKKWHNSHWSDETKTNLFGNDAQRNVRHPKFLEFQINFSKKTVKHGGSNIMIWG